MFSDPISLTLGSITHSLARVKVNSSSATYQNSDGSVVLEIEQSTTNKGRIRTLTRLTVRKVVADPLTAANDYETCTLHTVLDRPSYGFTVGDVTAQFAALQGFDTVANVTKRYGGEF